MWGLTYIGASGGFSRRQGARTEDRGAGRTAELRERVWNGWERRCPQLLLLLLQPPGLQRKGKGKVILSSDLVILAFAY